MCIAKVQAPLPVRGMPLAALGASERKCTHAYEPHAPLEPCLLCARMYGSSRAENVIKFRYVMNMRHRKLHSLRMRITYLLGNQTKLSDRETYN